jgi:hypothetical protein
MIERNFDKVGELRNLGGKCFDFDIDDGNIYYIINYYRG